MRLGLRVSGSPLLNPWIYFDISVDYGEMNGHGDGDLILNCSSTRSDGWSNQRQICAFCCVSSTSVRASASIFQDSPCNRGVPILSSPIQRVYDHASKKALHIII